jgi:ParB family chromosome partitioning protein
MAEKPKRPELTAPLQNYIDLHRHAVVRSKVASKPMLALRLVLAHAIVGSNLFSVRAEAQRALTDAIGESVETCPSEAVFDVQRRSVLASLGFDAEAPTVTNGYTGDSGISGLLMRLLDLPDETILEALAIVMAETLEAGTPLIETLGLHLQVDMAEAYSVDEALLDLIKDREVLDSMVAEVAGQVAADANANATGKVKRQIIGDCLASANGRAKAERFVPRWMAFPPSPYTTRGGVATVSRAAAVEGLFALAVEGDAPTEAGGGAEREAAAEPLAEAA